MTRVLVAAALVAAFAASLAACSKPPTPVAVLEKGAVMHGVQLRGVTVVVPAQGGGTMSISDTHTESAADAPAMRVER